MRWGMLGMCGPRSVKGNAREEQQLRESGAVECSADGLKPHHVMGDTLLLQR